jgi:hypothetical protein
MSQHHYHAIGGIMTGMEPGFYELGADTLLLIFRQHCHGSQPYGVDGTSIGRDRHRAEGNMPHNTTV